MGFLTKAQLRTRLQKILGNRCLDDSELDALLEMGLSEISSHVQFEQQKVCAYLDTVVGAYKYALPDRFLGMITLVDVTNKKQLTFTELRNFNLLEQDTATNVARGLPKFWSRRKDTLLIWPVPSEIVRLEMYYFEDFPTIPNTGTEIARAFDRPLLCFAAMHGFAEHGEDDESIKWEDRGIRALKARNLDEDWQAGTPSEGFYVSTDRSERTTFREVEEL